jgi:hypothetical protein
MDFNESEIDFVVRINNKNRIIEKSMDGNIFKEKNNGYMNDNINHIIPIDEIYFNLKDKCRHR